MSDSPLEHCTSSAVISVLPNRSGEIADAIARIPETQVHHVCGGTIVVVLEGAGENELGARLARIALMDHVLCANMVCKMIDIGDDG